MVDSATSTIVGETILINGHLNGDEDLTVLGRVEGTINLTKTLNIEVSGVVKADISVRNAVVSGIVVGNISASDSVEITDAGRMVGDIRAPRVIIVDGARFRGAVDMGDLEAPRPTGPLPARTVARAPSSLSRSSRPAPTPAPRRPLPPPPAATTEASRPASAPAPVPVPVPMARPAPAPVARAAPAPLAASQPADRPRVPMAGKKKLKKKVVIKKKG